MTTNLASTGDAQTYEIIGAAMDVYNELGCGFLEGVYREPFAIELARRGVPFKEEVSLPIDYKGSRLRVAYRVDFICWGEVLIELKALHTIGPLEMAQALNYLRAAGLHRALILNFGARSFQFKRVVSDYRG